MILCIDVRYIISYGIRLRSRLTSVVLKERNNPHLDALAVGRVERRGRVLEARVQRECGGDSSRSRAATARGALTPRRRAERLMVRCKVAAVRVPAFDEHLDRAETATVGSRAATIGSRGCNRMSRSRTAACYSTG